MNVKIEFDIIRRDKQELLNVLKSLNVQIYKDGKEILCPFHEDTTPSSGIYQSEDNGWRFKCHTSSCGFCGDVFDIKAHIRGITREKLIAEMYAELEAKQNASKKITPTSKPTTAMPRIYATIEKLSQAVEWSDQDKRGKIKKVYDYTHPVTGNLDLIVFRLERVDGSKTFRQAHQVAAGFILSSGPGQAPLYNRDMISESKLIIVCEGEKACEALIDIGFTATTSPGGAGKASLADWSVLAEKIVYVWPDADPIDSKTGKRTGIEHGKQIVTELQNLKSVSRILWVDPFALDLPPKGDAYDALDKIKNEPLEVKRELIKAILEKGQTLGAIADLRNELEDVIGGRRFAVPWPWHYVSELTQSLLPGTVTVLCGSPGATKSLFILQALAWWHEQGYRIACLELEDGRTFHLRRSLAQRACNSKITRDSWTKQNPEAIRLAIDSHTDFLSTFSHSIDELPKDLLPNVETVLLWIKRKASESNRVICIDPYTLLDFGDKIWVQDAKFIREAKRIIEDSGSSLILLSHPRRGAQTKPELITLDDMALSAALPRFAQTALWLHYHDDIEDYCRTPQGVISQIYNRTLFIKKSRNEGGQGNKIAFYFDKETLCLSERGVVE